VISVDSSFTKLATSQHLSDGSTLTAAFLQAGELSICHLGDSCALLMQKDGSWQKLTQEHTPAREAEAKRIRSEGGSVMKVKGGWRLDGVLAVSRAIGDVQFKKSGLSAEPEITRRPISPADEFLVLMTDGLPQTLSLKAVTDSIKSLHSQDFSYAQITKKLTETAIRNGAKDNVTVLIIDI